jgi:hypothetical protein
MDILQRLGIPLPIATGALGLIIALIAGMGLFGRKNQMPVDGRVCYYVMMILETIHSSVQSNPIKSKQLQKNPY